MTIITKDNFQTEVIESELPVLVDFWASWCGPCKMIAPILESLESEYSNKVKFAKLNIDDEGVLAVMHRVTAIPTLIIFQDGKVAERLVGLRQKNELKELLDSF